MSRHANFHKRFLTALLTAGLALALVTGCSRGPSQEELSSLEQQRMAAEAAEKKVAEKKAEKARLERQVAEKKATKAAAQKRQEATKAALTE
ncbi:MAG: hypothetical protein GKR89_28355 [Candidatus Latescibacteria bacterium]|nr:hypothetical protein [Candidatus Latescibacterota bacterium]